MTRKKEMLKRKKCRNEEMLKRGKYRKRGNAGIRGKLKGTRN